MNDPKFRTGGRRREPEPLRVTVLWHPRYQAHIPGIHVPERRIEEAAEIVATSNYFKPVRRA